MNEKEIRIMFDYLKVGIIIFILITCFFPFEKVFADTQTYYTLPENTTFKYMTYNNSDYFVRCSKETRAVVIKNSSQYSLYLICDTTFNFKYGTRNIGVVPEWDNTYNMTASTTSWGVTYYYGSLADATSRNNSSYFNSDVPVINRADFQTGGMRDVDVAYMVTYGDWAVSSQPVLNYDLLQVSYYTNIAGSGDSSSNNLDVISWQLWDINGQYIGDDNLIQIRAVPGHFVASDKPSLLQETFNSWVRESNLEVDVFKGSTTLQQKSFSWDYIAGLFSSIQTWGGRFWSIFASDDYWYQYGWIYEIRLLDENEEPLTEWQEIYTGTASKPQNTNVIENSDNLTPELVNTIEDINNENNVTNNWYINNITINMSPEETTDKPWWSYLLDAILELIRTIADLVGNLVDSLLGLFRFTTFEIPDWETKKTTIINNTGYFGQSILFVEDLKTTVLSASYVDPVLTYPGIQLDGVQLIPEVSVNLNDYVTSLGLTNFRSIAYTCTDGMIYLSLLVLVIKKLEDLLSK